MLRVNSRTPIHIVVTIDGEDHQVTTYRGEYRNLMIMIYDKFYVEGFGECKGIGRCGTCHIHLTGNDDRLLNRVGNENTTLAKMTGVTAHSRLACQILIDEELDGLHIRLTSLPEN